MKVKTSKRLLAYVLDIVIFLIFTLIALLFTPSSDKVIELSKNLDKLGELVLEESITLGNYLTSSADIIQKIDKLELIPNIVNVFFIILLFVVVPYITKGQTLGMIISKIKLIKTNREKPSMLDYILRASLVYFLGYSLITILLVNFIPSIAYFVIASILLFLEILLVIISFFMLLYRHDRRGLCDILTKTKVVKCKR